VTIVAGWASDDSSSHLVVEDLGCLHPNFSIFFPDVVFLFEFVAGINRKGRCTSIIRPELSMWISNCAHTMAGIGVNDLQ